MSRVDLNLFLVFDAIYSEGSITRAATLLNLTQPAVSHALARLRDALNDELFVRSRQGMLPTPLAKNMIGPVRESLSLLNKTLQETRQFEPAHAEKVFRLNLRDVFEVMLLPPLARLLADQAPGITLESVKVNRDRQFEELVSGRLDLTIDVQRTVDDTIFYERLSQDHHVCLVSPDHPDIHDSLTLEQYLQNKHVLVSSRNQGPGFVDMELQRFGLRRAIGLRVQHHYAAALIASQTHLLLTVPERFARQLKAHVPLRDFYLPLSMHALEAYLYWHSQVDNDPGNRWLREQITALFGSGLMKGL